VATLGPGDRAPEFSTLDLDLRERRLGALLERGPVVLAFGKATCGTCELAFPYLERLFTSYPSDAWSALALLQDAAGPARRFAQRFGLTFPIATEVAPYPISQAYDPEATPTIFLIDSDGTIADAQGGFSKAGLNRLAAALAARIGAEPVEIAPAGDGKPSFRPG
jgi:peroxiredoxin